IKLEGTGPSISPPMDRDFFTHVRDDYLKNHKYNALLFFKKKLFGHRSNVGMEELWTRLDLNHKHIFLDTYDWREETKEYFDSEESQYPLMDILPLQREGVINTALAPNKFKLLGDAGRDFRRLIYSVYSSFDAGEQNYFRLLHDKVNESG